MMLLFTNPYDLVIVETRIGAIDGLVVWRAENGSAYVVLSYASVPTLERECTDPTEANGDASDHEAEYVDHW